MAQKTYSALLQRLIEFEEAEGGMAPMSRGFASFPYASKDEPHFSSPLGRRLFPDAHEGNVRRLLRFIYSPENTVGISGSTLVWLGLWVLRQTDVADDNTKSYAAFAQYVEQLTGQDLNYKFWNLHPYWRRIQEAAHPGGYPLNYDIVMQWLTLFWNCIVDEENEVDSRLFPIHPQAVK